MGTVGANGAEFRGSACGFPAEGEKVKGMRLRDRSCWKAASKIVLQGAETQPIQTYLDRRQATVSEWVALRPRFNVCARETGYEGGGNLRVPWQRQEAAEKQLKFKLEEILRRQGCGGDENL